MSYDREESYGRQEGRHHQGHQQGESRRQYGEDNEFQRNRAGERDGFADTGGYGPESQDPEYAERQRREQQQREEQRFGGGSNIPGSYGAGSRIKESHQGRQHGRNEDEDSEYRSRTDASDYPTGGGRRVVGSGVNSVELSGGNQEFRSDAYGGESGTYGNSYEEHGRTSETHQGREHRPNRVAQQEPTGYGGGNERRQQHGRQEYGDNEGQDRRGRNTVGTGVDSVALTEEGDRRRSGDLYGGESGTSGNDYGRGNQSGGRGGGGEWDVSSGAKYTPGAKVVLHAAEMETESNPYNEVATGLAGETQQALKQGLKDLEHKLEESFRR